MSRVLLTGFETFGRTPVNPAELVARSLDGAEIAGATVVSRILTNSFFICIEQACEAIAEIEPSSIVMLGEYGGRSMLTVERIAQNFNDGTRYQLQDNAGRSLQGQTTIPDGPAAYFSTLPIRAMVKAMREAGIPADISDTAGTFCCNHLMYGVLHHVAVGQLDVRAGWIHLPHLPEVAALPENLGAASMSMETATEGVSAAIAAIQRHATDITEPILSRLQI